MAAQREYAITGNGRRIYIASYLNGAPVEPAPPSDPSAVVDPDTGDWSEPAVEVSARVTLRRQFPTAEADYEGGQSDGYEYRVVFSARTWEQCYELVQAFLREEGYADVPVPTDAAELLHFRHPSRNRQVLLFADEGYVHNPLKILFPRGGKSRFKQLELRLYNERAEGHLLRFHGKR
jgi:hypothetical protein